MKTLTMKTSRREERAALRRGHPWKVLDVLLLYPYPVALVALFAPGVLADWGDTVIGSTAVPAGWESSYSSLLLAFARWGAVIGVLGLLWAGRETPWQQRLGWGALSVGILMNYARNVDTGNPGTFSFLLIQVALMWLLFRLTQRPTIYAQMLEAQEEARRCQEEATRATLRAEQAELALRLRGGP